MIKFKMKNLTLRIPALISMFFPVLAYAQGSGGTVLGTTSRIIQTIGKLVDMLIPIVIAVALLVFFWGLVKFIRSVSDSGKADGKMFMVWGLVAIFVMVAVWGILSLFAKELNISRTDDKPFVVPKVPRP